ITRLHSIGESKSNLFDCKGLLFCNELRVRSLFLHDTQVFGSRLGRNHILLAQRPGVCACFVEPSKLLALLTQQVSGLDEPLAVCHRLLVGLWRQGNEGSIPLTLTRDDLVNLLAPLLVGLVTLHSKVGEPTTECRDGGRGSPDGGPASDDGGDEGRDGSPRLPGHPRGTHTD